MKLSERFFRLRRWALILIFFIGFWAPFDRLGGAHPESTWLFLAGTLAHARILPIAYSGIAVMGVAILLTLLAALLRTWAAAYVGSGVVRDRHFNRDRIVADGPYRYVRNPLYVGLWLHTLALAILMPPGGAIFAIVGVGLCIMAFVHAEEGHLGGKHGETYTAYMQRVPRFWVAVRPRVPQGEDMAHWWFGLLGEIYMWGAVVTYIAFASRYDVTILEQGLLVSLGISIIVQGFLWPRTPALQ